MKKGFKRIGILFGVAFLFLLTSCGSNGDSKTNDTNRIIEKLNSFTTMKKTDIGYYFKYDGLNTWTISYVDSNEFLEVENSTVTKPFINDLGDYCFSTDETYKYDFSDNAFRLYFDEDITSISLIDYSLDDDEIIVHSDGEKYHASDTLIEFMKQHHIKNAVEKDIDAFKETLKEHDLSYDEITKLKFDDIEKYYEK